MTPKACLNCGTPHQRPQPYCEACEFMTPAEAMKRMRCATSTFYRVVKAGKLTPRKFSDRKMLILRAEVDALLG